MEAAPNEDVWDCPHCHPHRGALSAVRTQCGRGATIWAPSCTGDPYFVILGASLLPLASVLMLLPHGDMAFLDFHPLSPIPTPFHTFLLISTMDSHTLMWALEFSFARHGVHLWPYIHTYIQTPSDPLQSSEEYCVVFPFGSNKGRLQERWRGTEQQCGSHVVIKKSGWGNARYRG